MSKKLHFFSIFRKKKWKYNSFFARVGSRLSFTLVSTISCLVIHWKQYLWHMLVRLYFEHEIASDTKLLFTWGCWRLMLASKDNLGRKMSFSGQQSIAINPHRMEEGRIRMNNGIRTLSIVSTYQYDIADLETLRMTY